MKIVITVISMMLMFRGCYCVLNNHNNTLVRKATSNSTSEENENPLKNFINCFKEDSLFKCFNDRVGILIRVWREALLNSVRRNADQPLQVNQGIEYMIKDLGKAVYNGFTNFFYGNFSTDDDEGRSDSDLTSSDSSDSALGKIFFVFVFSLTVFCSEKVSCEKKRERIIYIFFDLMCD